MRSLKGAGDFARSGIAATEIMVATAVAHSAAGGSLPPVSWLAVLTAAVLGATLLVLRGRIRVRTAVPLLAVCQVVLHPAFDAGTTAEHTGHAAHGHAGPAIGLPMVLAHLVSVLATALILVLQDRAVALTADWLDAWTRRPELAIEHRSTSPASWVVCPSTRRELLLCSPRRGPPASVLLSP